MKKNQFKNAKKDISEASKDSFVLSGFRSIEQCIRTNPERIKQLIAKGQLTSREARLLDLGKSSGVRVERIASSDEGSLIAVMKGFEYQAFSDALKMLKAKIEAGNQTVVIALDGITDPQNLGAILRTAAFFGVDAVILPRERSVGVNEAAYRIASGGAEHVKVCQVPNLIQALKGLKDIGHWIVGFSEHAPKALQELKADFSPVIIIGNEEKGMRPLVEESCDFLLKIQSLGELQSLNAAVASSLGMAWARGLIAPAK